jgi:hypothetical protein
LHRPAAEHGLDKLPEIGIHLTAGQARGDRTRVRDNSRGFVRRKIGSHRGVSAKRERSNQNCSGE